MDLSVWRDVTSQDGGRSGSRDVIVGLRGGNRIRRVSPDSYETAKAESYQVLAHLSPSTLSEFSAFHSPLPVDGWLSRRCTGG